ncbi:uncharacterized protein LOC112510041 [Cynara cardunculus var. scolymus]|uniref:Uncharacterized protein n=1 Tax=Cynara cardunculus var. scolymus TaxID=59895 RepID=A0A103YDN2_CYNCS|nr:uncharacterized protein LOC112510041 [Cynara cardunculus var. scolymus]KVI07174.1 hypothetical protein Ccrd_014465 [Cynara cardunculus var. scolymus]
MDANRASKSCRWTNDRHLHFLKSVEATFVRTVLEDGGGGGRLLRMDRYLPDSCESTLDSKTTSCMKRRKRHFPSDNLETSIRVRRLRLHPFYPSSQDDQVVPEIKPANINDKKWSNSSSSSS